MYLSLSRSAASQRVGARSCSRRYGALCYQVLQIAWISALVSTLLSSVAVHGETQLVTNGEIEFYSDSFLIADDYALITFRYDQCLGCSHVQQWHFELQTNGFVILSQDVDAQTSVYPKASQGFASLTPGQTYRLTVSTVGLQNAFNDDVSVSKSVDFTTRSDLQCSVLLNAGVDTSGSDVSTVDIDTVAVFFSSEAYAVNYAQSYSLCGRTWRILDYGPYSSSARYVAVYSEQERTVLVAFRGTDFTSAADLIVNLNVDSEPCSRYIYNNRCQGNVHQGYAQEYQQVATRLRASIRTALQAGYRRILVTGHSQGAAQATIVAYDLLQLALAIGYSDVEVRHANFGSPSALDSTFAAAWDDAFQNRSVRFVNRDAGGTRDVITTFFPRFTQVQQLSIVNVPGDCGDCHGSTIYFKQVASNARSVSLHSNPWSLQSGAVTLSSINNADVVATTQAPLTPNVYMPAPVGSAATLVVNVQLLGAVFMLLVAGVVL
jgi:hypothetical protein